MKKWFLLLCAIAIGCLMAQAGLSAAADQQGKVVWELLTSRDFSGPVQKAAAEADGRTAYLATMTTLYEVKDGKTRIIAEQPEKESRLALAPGGGVYAYLTPNPAWRGLFSARLFDIMGKKLTDLQLKEFPHGFGALYLGFRGNVIVTSSPLDDWQGLGGRFQFAFWSRQGEALGKVVVEGRHSVALDPSGESILLIGDKEATAFSSSGKELWRLAGSFRKAAIAKGGAVALLNPASAKEIDRVLIFKGSGEPTVVHAPTPVHGLALSADGSSAAVIGDRGRYFFLDLSKADLKEGPRLKVEGAFYIFNAEFMDSGVLALGLLRRSGEPPRETWPYGGILAVDAKGDVLLRKEFPVRQATASMPAIDVTFGSRHIIGYTNEMAVLMELKK